MNFSNSEQLLKGIENRWNFYEENFYENFRKS